MPGSRPVLAERYLAPEAAVRKQQHGKLRLHGARPRPAFSARRAWVGPDWGPPWHPRAGELLRGERSEIVRRSRRLGRVGRTWAGGSEPSRGTRRFSPSDRQFADEGSSPGQPGETPGAGRPAERIRLERLRAMLGGVTDFALSIRARHPELRDGFSKPPEDPGLWVSATLWAGGGKPPSFSGSTLTLTPRGRTPPWAPSSTSLERKRRAGSARPGAHRPSSRRRSRSARSCFKRSTIGSRTTSR